MKALSVHGPGKLQLDEVAVPEPGPEDVVVKVAACGVCGSDLSYWKQGGLMGPSDTPLALGHELAGTVAEVGPAVRGIAPGLRVIVDPTGPEDMIGSGGAGAFAPYLLVRKAVLGRSLHPIPDALGFERAALAEPLSVSLHGVNRSGARPGQKAVVFGAGPIGLGVVLHLRRRGLTDIVSVDLSEKRLELARALGASATVNPRRTDLRAELGRLHGAGALYGWPTVGSDLYFEVSGAPGVIPDVIGLAKLHAHLVVISVNATPVPVNFQMALGKEMTITTSLAYPDEFPEVVGMLTDGSVDVTPLISHRFGFQDVLAAFETARDAERAAKVMVTFD